MTDSKDVRGIDGWLLVFLVGCCATSLYFLIEFGSARIFEQWMSDNGLSVPPLAAAETLAYRLLRIALPLVVLWRMIVLRRWSTILLAIALIWLLFVGTPLIDYGLALSNYGWARVGPAFWAEARRVGIGAFLAVGPTLYLIGSNRVAATYPRVDYDKVFD